jgi:hypothetical protein
MGLLDDAIREHLELKRRRGGDPSEIERAERDALGPVRREPEPIQAAYEEGEDGEAAAAADLPGGGDLGEHPLVEFEPGALDDSYAQAPSVEFDEPRDPVQAPGRPEPPLPYSADASDAEAAAGPDPFGLRDAEDAPMAPPSDALAAGAMPHEEAHEDPVLDPRHDPLPEPAEPSAERDHLNRETAEYRLEHVHGAEEDPLEETPEFLQDTPDHDRLWFEQRPPRDFDFDK